MTTAKAIPIKEGRRTVGKVKDGVFEKNVSASKHFLRSPQAIAFGVKSLQAAVDAKAAYIQVTDKETKTVYVSTMTHFRKYSFPLDRGFGRQFAMVLDKWTVKGEDEPKQIEMKIETPTLMDIMP